MTKMKYHDYLSTKTDVPTTAQDVTFASARAVTRARERTGLTQRQLADLAEMPQSTISRIERGANTSVDTLSKLAAALGKTLKISFE
ncbi:helix-turn-helix domain-containing protein [Lactiplantibacillus plajomi]|uniref:Multiprotein-bridging factor 1 family protein n=1 Tax=Lactiplantibacillus plajomi TaxID=1457217 RepID=A0ABV6K607_9LACO|nr:helix-turn-helix transcriptional regulator [Lactiplantibacillus plajomi]